MLTLDIPVCSCSNTGSTRDGFTGLLLCLTPDNFTCQGRVLALSGLTCVVIYILDFYEDAVPFDSPPSYKGLAVKYCYKITVGAGRLQSSTQLVRLPVRILVLEGKLLCYMRFPCVQDFLG
jgi:hypothetical protein